QETALSIINHFAIELPPQINSKELHDEISSVNKCETSEKLQRDTHMWKCGTILTPKGKILMDTVISSNIEDYSSSLKLKIIFDVNCIHLKEIPGLKMSDADLILTAEENKALLDTWGIIAKDLKGYGSKFFIHFFKQYPHYQLQFKSFAKVPLEELAENRRFKAHALTLMSALNGFIENLDDVEMLDELLLKTGENHAKRKLTGEDFVVTY
ncbi:unnamed protein product, partial [Allacma fusca]